MTVELIIRPSCYDDPDAVALTRLVQDFYRQIYGGQDDSPLAAEEFAPPSGLFLLGHLDGVAVAMGGWRFLNELAPVPAARPVEIKRMFVRPEARGRGLGLTLLRALEDSAAVAGADWALLETGRPQVAALGLYRAAGYTEVPSFGYYACAPLSLHLGRRLGPPRVA